MPGFRNKSQNATPVWLADDDGNPISGGGGGGGDASAANQVTGNNSLASIDGKLTSPLAVQGTVADAATASGNPVPTGGVYPTTNPTYTNGQRVQSQYTARGQLQVALTSTTGAVALVGITNDAAGVTTPLIFAASYNSVYDPAANQWNRARGDVTGAWSHSPPSTASSALSGSIATSGGTAAIVMTNVTRSEVINPSTAVLWASWGTPTVNGAGSFAIAANGSYSPPDRVAGTLTLLSTAANQNYTVNRFS